MNNQTIYRDLESMKQALSKRKKRTHLFWLVLTLGAGILSSVFFYQGNRFQLEDGAKSFADKPLSLEEVQKQLIDEAQKANFQLQINKNPIFKTGDSEGTLYIQNALQNYYTMQVNLYDANKNCIYNSKMLVPGAKVLTAKLLQVLPKGDHPVTAVAYAYYPDSEKIAGSLEMDITITVVE